MLNLRENLRFFEKQYRCVELFHTNKGKTEQWKNYPLQIEWIVLLS